MGACFSSNSTTAAIAHQEQFPPNDPRHPNVRVLLNVTDHMLIESNVPQEVRQLTINYIILKISDLPVDATHSDQARAMSEALDEFSNPTHASNDCQHPYVRASTMKTVAGLVDKGLPPEDIPTVKNAIALKIMELPADATYKDQAEAILDALDELSSAAKNESNAPNNLNHPHVHSLMLKTMVVLANGGVPQDVRAAVKNDIALKILELSPKATKEDQEKIFTDVVTTTVPYRMVNNFNERVVAAMREWDAANPTADDKARAGARLMILLTLEDKYGDGDD